MRRVQQLHVYTIHSLKRHVYAEGSVIPCIDRLIRCSAAAQQAALAVALQLAPYADLAAVLIAAQDAGYETIHLKSGTERNPTQSMIISRSWKATDHVSSR